MIQLAPIFAKVLNAKYIHIPENAADFSIEAYNQTMNIYFQWSVGKEDWKNNFDFACVPYNNMPQKWKAHRGFVRVWKTIEPYIKDYVEHDAPKKIVIGGYSHGGAIAILCHEFIKYNYPDIDLETYAFEAPRVFCGTLCDEVANRWETCYVIKNGKDLVTHLPPKLFGYKEVGKAICVGSDREIVDKFCAFKCINEHLEQNVMNSLKKFDDGIC